MSSDKVTAVHLARRAIIYVRQSTPEQVATNIQSQRRQFGLVDHAVELGWQMADVSVNYGLLLGLKGTMSEVELHLIQSRLHGGLWEAARRGELRPHLTVGFVYDHEGRMAITPDEAIRQAIALIFSKFAELGSARQVAAYLVSEQL